MPQTCETRAYEARASRNSCGGWFRDPHRPCALQSQFLIASSHLGLEMSAQVSERALGRRWS